MPYYGTHRMAVNLRDAACPGVEVGAYRPCEGRPSCNDGLSRGGLAHGEEVEDGFRTGDRWEGVVDYIVGARE